MDITGIYFVLADDRQARFVRPGPDDRLHTVAVLDRADARQTASHRAPGQARERGARPAASKQVRFTRQLAKRIKDDFAVDLFSHVVLVAPPPVLRELTDLIDGPAGASLLGGLPIDLMTASDPELWQHLDEWVRPACHA
jgi:hypothetical protein